MKLYRFNGSTACRPVEMFAAEAGIALELVDIDLFKGEQMTPGYAAKNPVQQVPTLEKIPFDFHYRYECDVDGKTSTYRHKLVDWEVGALYRRLRKQFGAAGWEKPFREKYEQELPGRDLHLLLGTIHRFPDQWLAVSVICPPKQQPEGLNQQTLF